jgi:hypothetical protein
VVCVSEVDRRSLNALRVQTRDRCPRNLARPELNLPPTTSRLPSHPRAPCAPPRQEQSCYRAAIYRASERASRDPVTTAEHPTLHPTPISKTKPNLLATNLTRLEHRTPSPRTTHPRIARNAHHGHLQPSDRPPRDWRVGTLATSKLPRASAYTRNRTPALAPRIPRLTTTEPPTLIPLNTLDQNKPRARQPWHRERARRLFHA